MHRLTPSFLCLSTVYLHMRIPSLFQYLCVALRGRCSLLAAILEVLELGGLTQVDTGSVEVDDVSGCV